MFGVRAVLVWVAWLALAGSGRTLAQRDGELEGLSLVWDAPAACPDRAQLLSRIREHLSGDPRTDGGVSVRARVDSRRGRYALTLRLLTGQREVEREATAATCGALADLTALLVALALDPAASVRDDEAERTAEAPAAPPDAEPSSQTAAPPASTAPNTPEHPVAQPAPLPPVPSAAAESGSGVTFTHGDVGGFAVDLGFAFALQWGMSPQSPAPGAQARAGVRIGRLRAMTGFAFWPELEAEAEPYPSARLAGRGLVGDLGLGAELTHAPISLVASAQFEAGELTVATRGIAQPGGGRATWLAAGGRMHAAYRLWKGLELGVELCVIVPFSRPSWFVHLADRDLTVFTVAPITLRGALGLAYVIE